MPFPNHVFVSLNKEGSFSCPPKEFREKMIVALKDFFGEKLEEEPWGEVQAALWYVVQQLRLFKEKRMMVKLRNISDDRENSWVNPKVRSQVAHQFGFPPWGKPKVGGVRDQLFHALGKKVFIKEYLE